MPSIWMAIYSCSQALYWISFSLSLSHCHCVFVTVTELFRHSYLSNFRRTCSCCSESPPSSSCKLKIVSSKKHLLEHMTDPEHFQTNNWWKKNFHSHSVFFFSCPVSISLTGRCWVSRGFLQMLQSPPEKNFEKYSLKSNMLLEYV